MASLVDTKFAKLRLAGHTGAMSDMLLQWLQAGGATSSNINDAWREWLDIQGYTSGSRADDWFSYLRAQGYTGAKSDMELQFWEAQ
jgi:hypothetical protein